MINLDLVRCDVAENLCMWQRIGVCALLGRRIGGALLGKKGVDFGEKQVTGIPMDTAKRCFQQNSWPKRSESSNIIVLRTTDTFPLVSRNVCTQKLVLSVLVFFHPNSAISL